jgi:hypothetical protein
VIPGSVEILGSLCSERCESLSSIYSNHIHIKEIGGFFMCGSLRRIEIPSSVEIISRYGFSSCSSLTEVIFASDCHIKEIGGFFMCGSLRRIKIPSSVEIISQRAFHYCSSLRKVIVASDYHVNEIDGFSRCRSLQRIEIPRLAKVISVEALPNYPLFWLMEFSRDDGTRKTLGFRGCKALIIYDEDHFCRMRRCWHLQLCMR